METLFWGPTGCVEEMAAMICWRVPNPCISRKIVLTLFPGSYLSTSTIHCSSAWPPRDSLLAWQLRVPRLCPPRTHELKTKTLSRRDCLGDLVSVGSWPKKWLYKPKLFVDCDLIKFRNPCQFFYYIYI